MSPGEKNGSNSRRQLGKESLCYVQNRTNLPIGREENISATHLSGNNWFCFMIGKRNKDEK